MCHKGGNNLYQNTGIRETKKSVNTRDKYQRMTIVKRKRDAPNNNTFYYNVIDYLDSLNGAFLLFIFLRLYVIVKKMI